MLVSRNIDQSPQCDKVSEFVETKAQQITQEKMDLWNIRKITSFDENALPSKVTLEIFRKYLWTEQWKRDPKWDTNCLNI